MSFIQTKIYEKQSKYKPESRSRRINRVRNRYSRIDKVQLVLPLFFVFILSLSYMSDGLFLNELLVSCFIICCLFLLKTFEKEK
jgi:hypothetical protein